MTQSQIRCRACQLQLCKSREEPPHVDLQAAAEGAGQSVRPMQGTADTAYTCQKCGTSLVNSSNRTVAGSRKLAA